MKALAHAMESLEKILVPHIESKNTELATVVCTALTHVATARGVLASLEEPEPEDPEEDLSDV
jgi:hypothetical protein